MLHIVNKSMRRSSALTEKVKIVGTPPPLSSPEEWFEFNDPFNLGYIMKERVIACAIVQIKPDREVGKKYIRKKIERNWPLFVEEEDDYKIFKENFSSCGLLQYLETLGEKYHSLGRRNSSISVESNVSTDSAQMKQIDYTGPEESAPKLHSTPNAWFTYYDKNSSTTLSKEQILLGFLDEVLPETNHEVTSIQERINNVFSIFDSEGNGEISRWDFLARGGMGETLLAMMKDYSNNKKDDEPEDLPQKDANNEGKRPRKSRQRRRCHYYTPPPMLSGNPSAWFDYFDRSPNRTLSQKDMIHALYTTFNATSKERQALIKQVIRSNWNRFDIESTGFISKDIFLNSSDSNDTLASILIDLELKLNINANDGPRNDSEKIIKIKINIPNGKEPFNLIQVTSPKTKEFVMLSIPDKADWGGSGAPDEPFYFTVKF